MEGDKKNDKHVVDRAYPVKVAALLQDYSYNTSHGMIKDKYGRPDMDKSRHVVTKDRFNRLKTTNVNEYIKELRSSPTKYVPADLSKERATTAEELQTRWKEKSRVNMTGRNGPDFAHHRRQVSVVSNNTPLPNMPSGADEDKIPVHYFEWREAQREARQELAVTDGDLVDAFTGRSTPRPSGRASTCLESPRERIECRFLRAETVELPVQTSLPNQWPLSKLVNEYHKLEAFLFRNQKRDLANRLANSQLDNTGIRRRNSSIMSPTPPIASLRPGKRGSVDAACESPRVMKGFRAPNDRPLAAPKIPRLPSTPGRVRNRSEKIDRDFRTKVNRLEEELIEERSIRFKALKALTAQNPNEAACALMACSSEEIVSDELINTYRSRYEESQRAVAVLMQQAEISRLIVANLPASVREDQKVTWDEQHSDDEETFAPSIRIDHGVQVTERDLMAQMERDTDQETATAMADRDALIELFWREKNSLAVQEASRAMNKSVERSKMSMESLVRIEHENMEQLELTFDALQVMHKIMKGLNEEGVVVAPPSPSRERRGSTFSQARHGLRPGSKTEY